MRAEDVVARASEAAFGRPLVTNVLRSQLVEAMIALALEPEWTWCSADYASWDFECADGCCLEVKQSSYRQSWTAPAHGKVTPRFDIAHRKGRWEGAVWVDDIGRAAHLYVLAYHDVRDDSADHRDPDQWEFFVISVNDLPGTKSIGLAAIRKVSHPVRIGELRAKISDIANQLAQKSLVG